MTVNTKKAERRDLRFSTLEELRADAESIRASHEAGTLTHSGNWTAGQCFWHLGAFMRASLDGFPEGRPPLWLRILGRHVFRRQALSGKPAPPGIKLPREVAWLDPSEVSSFEEGWAPFADVLDRVSSGARFTHASPVFGPLSHEEWIVLHAGHGAMHMSFQRPG